MSAAFPVRPGEEVISAIIAEGVAQPPVASARGDEGAGPFDRLEIRGVTVIDGTGQAPYGPVTVVVRGDRIAEILPEEGTGAEGAGPEGAGVEVIDARGSYLLPGFVDAHGHLDSSISANAGVLGPPEYVLKLWLAHGVTTVRDVGSFVGLEWTLEHARRSAAGTITAPRIYAYPLFPQISDVATPDMAREWIRAVHASGATGVKFILDSQRREAWKIPMSGTVVDIPEEAHLAALDEAHRLGLRTAIHHGPTQRLTALDHARLGVASAEHFRTLPAAVGKDGRPVATDEWRSCDPPGSPGWRAAIAEMVAHDFTLVPTFAILEARRDYMRASQAEWHRDYAYPALAEVLEPNPHAHGSQYLDHTTELEVYWRNEYIPWMRFTLDYKNAGGRVAAGSDAGFIHHLYGFCFIRELEMLREAGFTPLEVVTAATRSGAELIGSDEFGTIEVGKKADLVLIDENPLDNLKVLYGTGHLRYDPAIGATKRVGGIRSTIRDGIVWDARELLASVRAMVAAAR